MGADKLVSVQRLFKLTVNEYPLLFVELSSSSVEVTVNVVLVPCLEVS